MTITLRQISYISLYLFAVLFTVSHAFSEIYECDGKWTNRPCDGAIERTMPERSQPDIDQADIDQESQVKANEANNQAIKVEEPLAPRYALTRRLRKYSKEMTQKHNLSLTKEEMKSFEDRCHKRETPLAKCQSEYDQFVQRLNSQIKKPETR
jgi:hypothetical protein